LQGLQSNKIGKGIKKMKSYKDTGGKAGDRVITTSGRAATVKFFTPGYWSTHAIVEYDDGTREKVRLEELKKERIKNESQ
jgi:preprotein translocase subunit YajC